MINPAETGLAFIEGLALIASPCILPVLPLVLSTSATGGKARPFGIITGFVLAFSAFALASRQIIGLLHVAPETLRLVSLGLLFLFGLTLLIDSLSERFARWTQRLAGWGSAKDTGNGFGGGVAAGAMIGLVWTPCAGPIFATVLVQIIRQGTDAHAALITFAFALGAGIPMLLIALAGRKIMEKTRALSRHTLALRRGFAVVILAATAWLAFGDTASAFLWNNKTGAPAATVPALQDALPNPYPAPEFTGLQGWLNSEPLTLRQLRGKVVLVDFWTYSCINCVRTLPYLVSWHAKYRDQGLVIIGMHAPEFAFEKNPDNIRAAMTKYGISYAVAMDNNLSTWTAFNNRYWPAHYLIDQQGRVVYTHFGEGHYDVTEGNIRYLLGISGEAAMNPPPAPTLIDQTPETYLGYARTQNFVAETVIQRDTASSYRPVSYAPVHHWTLDGRWIVRADKIVSDDVNATLRLNFKSKKVYLVMGVSDGKAHVLSLKLNGAPLTAVAGKDAPQSMVTVKGHALYELVNQSAPNNSLLELTADSKGIEMYAFTFGE